MSQQAALLCGVGAHSCALPLAHVVEIMRPLPLLPLPGAVPCVLGMAVVRGSAVPVVDVRILLGAPRGHAPRRFVALSLGARRAVLAVDGVAGVVRLDLSSLAELPPLAGAIAADVIAAIATLDAALLLVLRTARLVPEAAWPTGEQPG